MHDAGVITLAGGTLVVTVLTQGFVPRWAAMDAIAQIALELIAACES